MYFSSIPSVERGYVLSSVVGWYISLHAFSGALVCVIVSGTAVHLFHRQWFVDDLSLFISSVVRWYISLIPSVGRWYMLSSVVRRCISLHYLQWNVGMCYHQW